VIGAISGDVIGSKYEFNRTKEYGFELFKAGSTYTDDTVLTVATASAVLTGEPWSAVYRRFYSRYPDRGYGGFFKKWASVGGGNPYNSFGNGSAMRVSPIGWAFDDQNMVIKKARESAEVTHNHPEGVKGAEATAWCVWAARNGRSKDFIKEEVKRRWGYELDRRLAEIRPGYKFDATCQGSVPESILCFLESSDFEDCIRLAVSLGGDSDTMGCISGAIAEAFYGGVPEKIAKTAFFKMDANLRSVVADFMRKYVDNDFCLDNLSTDSKEDLQTLMGTIFRK
jgi:ADP-ribosylglycohydrolase